MAIKDDIPGFHLNTQLHKNSENPRTLPAGYDYEVPLSLNAEICMSEFKNVEKALSDKKDKDGVKSVNVTSMID